MIVRLAFLLLLLSCAVELYRCRAALSIHSTLSLLPTSSDTDSNKSFKSFLQKLVRKEDLTAAETEQIWDTILSGPLIEQTVAVGALLVLLHAKGETPQEISGMVRSMKKACLPVLIDGDALDIVGTGGDGADTINISTASAILAAACGCKVAKAGNRSVSSACGSADVLEKLGIVIELTPEQNKECVENCGICFMYAPINHPAMKSVAPVRKALGVRTAFNLLGPITNAASANRVVIGVYEEYLVDLIGKSLIEIGQIEHGVVIHGCGLDEISPLGPSQIFEIKNISPDGAPKKYKTKKFKFDPKSVNIPRCSIEDLKGGDATENANQLREVLKGGEEFSAKRNSIILNAGMGLYVYGIAPSIAEGISKAREVLVSGAAIIQLDRWISTSTAIGSPIVDSKKNSSSWSWWGGK